MRLGEDGGGVAMVKEQRGRASTGNATAASARCCGEQGGRENENGESRVVRVGAEGDKAGLGLAWLHRVERW